jgi:hypothetical protein
VFAWGDREWSVPALEIAWLMQVQTIVPLVALILGSAAVAEEVEERTITYLFTRPVPRAAILLGRWLALALILSVILWLSAWAVFEILDRLVPVYAERQSPELRWRLVQVIVLGGVVYSAVFAAAGAFFKHPIIVGLGYTFAIEGFLANLPGGNPSLTIQFYLKSFLLSDDPALSRRLVAGSEALEFLPRDEALHVLGWIVLGALLLGSIVISRRQYVLPS